MLLGHWIKMKSVMGASKALEELENINKKGAQNNHDFTQYIGKEEIADLALFMKKGLIDTTQFMDDEGVPIGGNIRIFLTF